MITSICEQSEPQVNASTALNTPLSKAVNVFNEYGSMIRSTIRSYVNDETEVDDIYQDFFLSLINHPIPPSITNLKSYLRRALKNDVLDASRKRTCELARNARYLESRCSNPQIADPRDTMILSEAIENALRVIEEQLKQHEAAAVINRYYLDKDTEQAAQAMGVNKRSIARYLCMGLKNIRTYLKENPEVATTIKIETFPPHHDKYCGHLRRSA